MTHYLVLQYNRNHGVNLPSASISCAPSQQQHGSRKVKIWQSSATHDVHSQEGKQDVQHCSRWQNKHTQLKLQNKHCLTCYHQLINAESNSSLEISIDLAP